MERGDCKKIGELLIEAELITDEELSKALVKQTQTGRRLGEILIEMGAISEEELMGVLEFQFGIPYVNLEQYTVDYHIASKIPERIARQHTLVAMGVDGDKLKVAMKNPFDLLAIEDIKLGTGKDVVRVLSSERNIEKLLDQIYISQQTKHIVLEMEIETHLNEQPVEENPEDEKVLMIQFLDNILESCILKGASDIHIEPFERYVRIRYRVDGQLYELERISKEMLSRITTRIKILSGLDIAEKRLPQDGRMSKQVNGQRVDLRISILPTIYGEKTVIRIMYRMGRELELEEIGFHPEDFVKVQKLLRTPHGMILLTGPTGSGKSTTLAAALKVLNKGHINVITVEDPVEHMIEGINQVTVSTKVGLTFANALRSILRQDPDIIMIGEMRDSETSSIAIRAAITGHLVLSTLHTNDAVSSIPRLVDMGTESYMVGATVKGVISQRLVRKLCAACKEKHQVTANEQRIYGIQEGMTIYKPKGCSSCNQTGYKGRIAVHEVLVIDSYMEDIISSGKTSSEELKIAAVKRGMRTLYDNARYSVLQGKTSMTEMLRITFE